MENESDFMKVFELCIRILINKKDYIHLQQLKKLIGSSALDNLNNINNMNSMSILEGVLTNTPYEAYIW